MTHLLRPYETIVLDIAGKEEMPVVQFAVFTDSEHDILGDDRPVLLALPLALDCRHAGGEVFIDILLFKKPCRERTEHPR